MPCPKCGGELPRGVTICPKCGSEFPMKPAPTGSHQEPPTKRKFCALAIISLILAVLILYPMYAPIFGISAMITGAGALVLIARSQGKLRGHILAVAAVALGIVGTLFFPVILTLESRVIRALPPSVGRPVARFTGLGMMVYGAVRARASRVRTDLRTIDMALEAYYRDHNSYPAYATGQAAANSFAGSQAGAYHIHTFRIWRDQSEVGKFATLTTPVAYLSHYLPDPFAWTRGATYGYYSDGTGYILYSWGPDMDERLNHSWDLEPDVEMVYKSTISQPSPTLIAGTSSSPAHEAYTYDPTNGTYNSPGDIWRVKQ